MAEFDVDFSVSSSSFDVDFSESSGSFDAELLTGSSALIPSYPGPYTVVPKTVEEQRLLTSGKSMKDDVVVTEIPFFKISNIYGDTVHIAPIE